MNVIIIDIETSPTQADVWGLHDVNVGLNQIRKPGQMLSWAAKWLDSPEEEVIYDSIHQSSRARMIRHVHALLSDADVVVGFNSKAFDVKTINREFVMAGLGPVAPFKQVDLLQVARSNFKFQSNKLQYIAGQLKIGHKVQHQGHGLWTLCEQGDPDAWKLFEKYNRQDVMLTERLYKRLLPWIKSHPSHGAYDEPGAPCCPSCGGFKLQRRGYARTTANKYVRLHCVDCGTWSREAFSENNRRDRERLVRQL